MLRSIRAARAGALLTGALAALLAAGTVPVAAASPAAEPALTITRVAGGFERPILVTNDGSPKRRLFVVEQSGRIRVLVYKGGRWQKKGVFLDLRGSVLAPPTGGNEQGLLGLAFAPDYATSGRFYVDYTRKGRGGKAGDTVVAEYRRSSALVADPRSGRTLLVVDQPYDNHNGGHLAFGPDGKLYLGLGDGGSGGDPEDRAQDGSTLLGKLLRIDPRDPDGSGPKRYTIPGDNPFLATAPKDEIWLSGVRNPWRYSFDRLTGDLWIGDVGQSSREEIDRLPAIDGVDAGKGANLGWNVCEGDRTYPGGSACPAATYDFTAPVFTYGHSGSAGMDGGCSVTGGVVVRDPDATAWAGRYLFADICSGQVGVLDGGGTLRLTQATGLTISSFGEDAAGRIFLVGLDGVVRRVRFSSTAP